jgi:hypothetical protein
VEFLVFVLVRFQSTDEAFVNLNFAAQPGQAHGASGAGGPDTALQVDTRRSSFRNGIYIDDYRFSLAFREGVMYYRSMETPVSKSQKRALKLMGLPATDSYKTAAKSLEAAWCRPDGIPHGCTWRTAASLTDAALIAGIKIDYEAMADSKIEY